MRRMIALCGLMLVVAQAGSAREMTSMYMVTQVANTTGQNSTDWHTDLTLYNPQAIALPVVVQFLEANRDNSGSVPTLEFDVLPWETLNLWNILGPYGFNRRGVNGALLVLADDLRTDCSGYACDFGVFARTYTVSNRWGLPGEFGQAAPGYPAHLGLDWDVIGFLPQLMDNNDFRTNLGMASLTGQPVGVRVDLQDSAGNVIGRWDHTFPPFAVAQWRLPRGVSGGTAAVYVMSGPADAMVFPYASVVHNSTGDAVTIEPHFTLYDAVALGGASVRVTPLGRRPATPARAPVPGFSLERLRQAPVDR